MRDAGHCSHRQRLSPGHLGDEESPPQLVKSGLKVLTWM